MAILDTGGKANSSKKACAGIFKLLRSQGIDAARNRFRQPIQPGGPERNPYSYSVPNPHGFFQIPALVPCLSPLPRLGTLAVTW
jgi:hypothetical protein